MVAKNTANTVLDVAAYYRMSSEDQVGSIEQQQKEVRAYARARGWRIVREYIDSGKSGSKDVHKRVEFHELIADSGKGEWSAVLVYDSSRFGRLDSIDAAPFKSALRKNGVHLETVKEGRIDWNTSMGRLQDAMMNEANSEYSKKLAGNVLRGRIAALEGGFWPHGKIPFGYSRELVENGVVKMIVPRNEKFRKPGNWKLRLVISDKEAKSVRWAFDNFSKRDLSARQMAAELSERFPVSPTGLKGWGLNSVRDLLTNPAYCGDVTMGMRGWLRGAFEHAEKTIKQNSCPAIVSRSLWNAVQKRMTDKRQHETRRRVRGIPGALSGVLHCGHCGYRMEKKHAQGKTYYVCASYSHRPHLGCRAWRALESEVLPNVCRELIKGVDFELVRNLNATGPSKPTTERSLELDRLEGLAAELERKIARGSENILICSPDVFPELQKTLLGWKSELERIRNTVLLAQTEVPGDDKSEWLRWWEQARTRLVEVSAFAWGNRHTRAIDGQQVEVEEPIAGVWAEPEVLRALLLRLNCRITLNWKPNGEKRFSLDKGLLEADFTKDCKCQYTNTPASPATPSSSSLCVR